MKTLEQIPKFNTYRQFLESHTEQIQEALKEKGQKFKSYKRNYHLFHIDQTKPIHGEN